MHLLAIVNDAVQLQFSGSCKSCPSSAVTLELAVEDAIRTAAPEVSSIEVVAADSASAAKVIPAESLMAKVHANGAVWHQVPDLAELAPDEVGGFVVAGISVLACRIGDQVYSYRDHCPACEGSLAGAALHRGVDTEPVLRCPRCRSRFRRRARRRWRSIPALSCHLDPMPLLIRDGVMSLAVLAEAMGARHEQSFDVLARITGNRRAPEPAGERCEMCSEQIADEHQHVVNTAARQLMCVCRGCYLLFTDDHADAALSRGSRPVSCLSRLCAGSTHLGGAADPRRCGVLFPKFDPRPHRGVLPRAGGRYRVRTRPRSLEQRSAPPNRGCDSSLTTSRRCWCGFPVIPKLSNRPATWFRLTPVTSSSAGYECCGAASTADKKPARSSTTFSRRSRRAALSDDHDGLGIRRR